MWPIIAFIVGFIAGIVATVWTLKKLGKLV
jgi:hypothetical protein